MKQPASLRMAVVPLLAAGAVALGGCDIFGDSKGPPLPGTRTSVLGQQTEVKPDGVADVRLPRPVVNDSWPQSGGFANFAMHHLELGENPQVAWSADVGVGSGSERQLLAPPVIADGKLFVKDAESTVSAFEAATGKLLWRKTLTNDKTRDNDEFGGGLAYYSGRLFVTTGFAYVFSLDPNTGEEVWRAPVSAPVRGAPTVFQDRVLAITIDSRLHALAAGDGSEQWDYAALSETAAFMAGTSPSASGDLVVAPFSSGELVALRIDTGKQVWNESLIGQRRGASGPVAAMVDIRGRPVIDRDRAIAMGSAGQIAAIDLRTGARIWEKQVSGAQTPWVAGSQVFVVSGSAEVICLNRNDGKVAWVTPLTAFKDEKKREPVLWAGPVLAGDRLLLGSSTGELLSLSPYDGRPLGKIDLHSPIMIAPVVADRTVYVLTDHGRLIALR
ncbi:PQQ-binding-like beta-propeller repeat protein [Vineibacter terrae]|uniref:outer membrane protein assembly factor BamB family protein n=1 Tax=Vineibacter terrae TaxID=2586908 RepID=UPI002E2EB438|nr:PQQ-binding-like beta-propeller repeat protein [Vineibacter terrae]HEX2887164.1 PQQ-binding-like beta-propeller repeat protein [Vineibacter terrae]